MPHRVLAGIVLAVLAAAPATAGAVTRAQADRVAMRALKTRIAPKPVLLMRSSLVGRGTLIASGGPEPGERRRRIEARGGTTELVSRSRVFRTRGPAWVYWQDYDPGAAFVHPSDLVVVDRRGRVVHRRHLSWWPTLGGRRGRFPHRVAGRATRSAAPTSAFPFPAAFASQLARYPNDCLVTLGDRTEPGLAQDFDDLERFVGTARFMGAGRASSVQSLENLITGFSRRGCTDVVIAIFGHGWAPTGTPTPRHIRKQGARLATSDEGTITIHDVWRNRSGKVIRDPKGQPSRYTATISASELQAVLERTKLAAQLAHRPLDVKLIVSTCYGGRWFTDGLKRLTRVIYSGSQPHGTTKFRSNTAPAFRALLDRMRRTLGRDDFVSVILDAAPDAVTGAARSGEHPMWWDGREVHGEIAGPERPRPPGPGDLCETGPGRVGIELELQGLGYTTPDGRRLGWGYGSVTASGRDGPDETISFGRTSSDRGSFGPYDCGEAVTLRATPAPGSAFDHWESEGGCAGADPACTVTAAPGRTERAVFRVATATVTAVNEQSQHGKLEGQGIVCGDSGERRHSECSAVVRQAKDDEELYRLDAVANQYRTLRPEVESLTGCDHVVRVDSARSQCFMKITGDRTVIVVWKPG